MKKWTGEGRQTRAQSKSGRDKVGKGENKQRGLVEVEELRILGCSKRKDLKWCTQVKDTQ